MQRVAIHFNNTVNFTVFLLQFTHFCYNILTIFFLITTLLYHSMGANNNQHKTRKYLTLGSTVSYIYIPRLGIFWWILHAFLYSLTEEIVNVAVTGTRLAYRYWLKIQRCQLLQSVYGCNHKSKCVVSNWTSNRSPYIQR